VTTTPDGRAGSALEAIYAEARIHAGTRGPTRPLAAVAVIPWRTRAGALEVFVVERARTMAFMGGYWAFPGGRVDPADAGPREAARRELHEETGVDVPVTSLAPVARFVTPDVTDLRFDATYFLCELPAGAAPDAAKSGGELTDGRWIAPAEALARVADGSWLMPTPVTRSLEALAPGIDGAADRVAQAARDDDAEPRMWPLADRIALAMLATPTLPPATHTNCYLIGGRDVVAIDPGSPWPEEQAILHARIDRLAADGRRLVAIALTHHHGDHVGGAAALAAHTGAPILAHAETARLLAGRVAVARELVDGERLELGGDPPRTLRAVFTPGHAPGHLCFLEETTGWLVAGDMVASRGTILIDPSEGDMAAYLASLERLEALAPRALLPAHGAPIPDPAAKLAEYLRHRRWREAKIAAALGPTPATAADLTARAYDDTPAGLHALAERSLLSHLAKLVHEGRARRVGDRYAV
jgi:glyoxylase-like metal-dependent hydrolase (beta-lactamase superfamily II)/8-oxo-dGTP pyrophosphatase MutT (NUDIX family)